MAIQLFEDFQALFNILNKYEVKYIVVGGYAVIYHGYNRHTGDLDIWVEQSEKNYLRLIKAFSEFGIPPKAIEEKDFLENEMDVYTFGRPPVCVEILTAVKGLKFDEAFGHINMVTLDGVQVNMIDVRDLIKAKKAAGRYKDLDDVEHLEG